MFSTDERINRSDLLFQVKLFRDQVRAFESGTKYVRMKEEHEKARNADHRIIRRLEKELEKARQEAIHARDMWFKVCEDVESEKEKAVKAKDRKIQKLEKELKEAKETIRELRRKFASKSGEVYEVETKLEEEKEKNKALTAKINKDHTNSSKPSSMDPNHAVIHNSREKTGRKQGGQRGHIHHGRKPGKVTQPRWIPTPKEYLDTERYRLTGKIIRKQLIRIRVVTDVIEYQAAEYRDQITGQRVHAKFPEGLKEDVTYDASVKALAYIVNNNLYTSIDKTRTFLKDITHGNVDVSNGFICNLSKEFSEKTEDERADIFLKLATSPVLHADFTFGRRNGSQTAVMITATEDTVLYQGREKKGDKGVEGSPLEHYDGTVVSDHEAAITKHGKRHQECLSHVFRYAKGACQNDPEKKWAPRLMDWINETIEYWKEVRGGLRKYEPGEAEEYIDELKKITQEAKREYEEEPPTRYNREGYNLYKRIEEAPEEYVLFLRDPSVPPTNNLSERQARKFKRKGHQVMSFRSQAGVDYFCDGLSIMETIRANKGNLFDEVKARFES